jgi:acyl-CoA thioester hydrolase
MKSHTIDVQVEFEDTNAEGVVFYPKYFHWFERATNAFMKTLGLSHNHLIQDYHYAYPVTECGCVFTHTLRYDDKVQITTTLTEIHEQHFRLQHVVSSGELVLGSGFEVRVWAKIDEPEKNKHFVIAQMPPEMAAKAQELKLKQHAGKSTEFENIVS